MSSNDYQEIKKQFPIGSNVFRWRGKKKKHKCEGAVCDYINYSGRWHLIVKPHKDDGFWYWLPNDPLLRIVI